jgi:cytochrome c peroxidase
MRKNLLALGLAAGMAAACGPAEEPAPAPVAEPASFLPDMNVPADNPITPEKVELGKQLFFDTRISDNGQFSCETCHLPEMGWGDGLALSTNAAGNVNTRHSPTLYNMGYYNQFYWDGRMPTLEEQILAAWRGQVGATPDEIAARLGAIPGYAEQFQSAMGAEVTAEAIVDALSTFVRSLEADQSPWDRYELGEDDAVSADAIAGFDVFSLDTKANCTLCHLPPLYTDTLFHNIGVGFDSENPDLGRGAFLARQEPPAPDAESMNGAFKTPTLRNVTLHPPYFHDGSAATLDEAVDYVLGGGHQNEWLDEALQPREITEEEKAQLMAFLDALTTGQEPFERPELPPDPQ